MKRFQQWLDTDFRTDPVTCETETNGDIVMSGIKTLLVAVPLFVLIATSDSGPKQPVSKSSPVSPTIVKK